MNSLFALGGALNPHELVALPFRSVQSLADRELEVLRSIGDQRKRYSAGDEIVAEGTQAPRPSVIRSGWACRQRVLADGRRQILTFLLPGDPIGLTRCRTPEPTSIVALTAVETMDAKRIAGAVEGGECPGLANALSIIEAREQFRLIDHVVRLGRQSAYERMAHLLLELQQRLAIVGLGDSHRFPLPLSQDVLADLLGLSMVHVNRILQQLRRERLIELRSGVAVLLDADQLMDIAEYRPAQVTAARARPAGRPAAA